MGFIKEITNEKEIYEIIKDFDKFFNPTVSSIVGDLEAYSYKLYKYAKTIAIFENNIIVGFASFYCNDSETKTAFLAQICVNKDYSSKGYGTDLIKECERISKNNGMKKLRLEVYNKNVSGLAFYKKHNYKYEKDCSNDSIYMIKEL